MFHTDAIPIWNINQSGVREINLVTSKIREWSGDYKKFFVGRSDSIKNRLFNQFQNTEINESDAWQEYARNVRNRAHSYREDIDSGLLAFGFLESDGKPSDLGYKYVDACERNGGASTGIPISIFGSALLRNANYGAFLHYIYRLSEEEFSNNPLSFSAVPNFH